MFVYEQERTQDIVKRLVKLGNSVRMTTLIGCIVLFGALLALLGNVLFGELWWIPGLFGILIGYGLGVYVASMLIIMIEGMAQSLVAQGEILAALKEKSR